MKKNVFPRHFAIDRVGCFMHSRNLVWRWVRDGEKMLDMGDVKYARNSIKYALDRPS